MGMENPSPLSRQAARKSPEESDSPCAVRGFRYRLMPAPEQEAAMLRTAGVCRLVWNLALEQRMAFLGRQGREMNENRDGRYRKLNPDRRLPAYGTAPGAKRLAFLNAAEQERQLTALREEFDFIGECCRRPQSRTLRSLEKAFGRAFSKTGGWPNFKRGGGNDAFSYHMKHKVKVERLNAKWARVHLPGISEARRRDTWIKIRLHRDLPDRPLDVAIRRTARGWEISFNCSVERERRDRGAAVGIDRGVAVPAALSTGEALGEGMTARLAKLEADRSRALRRASRGERGSKRNDRALRRVAKIAEKKSRIRNDFWHKASRGIAKRYGTAAIEDFDFRDIAMAAKGIRRSSERHVRALRRRNREMRDVGWHGFVGMLDYKCASVVRVAPGEASRRCAACGSAESKSREKQADFFCRGCGHGDRADPDAARMILSRGSGGPLLGVEGYGFDHPEKRQSDAGKVA